MSTLPLEDELNEALYRDLWTIRQAMDQEAEPEGGPIDYTPPAHRYLPDLKAACAKLTEAQAKARAEISKTLEREVELAGFAGVNPVHEVAQRAPEVRRYWLVSRLALILHAGVEMLENEGRPIPAPTLPSLGKFRPGQQGAGK